MGKSKAPPLDRRTEVFLSVHVAPALESMLVRDEAIEEASIPEYTVNQITAMNPYLPVLEAYRPVDGTYDADWCKVVDFVYAWAASFEEVVKTEARLKAVNVVFQRWRDELVAERAKYTARREQALKEAREQGFHGEPADVRTADRHIADINRALVSDNEAFYVSKYAGKLALARTWFQEIQANLETWVNNNPQMRTESVA